MSEERRPFEENLGIGRRELIKRGAIVGGTLVWAAPAIQSLSRSALAQPFGGPSPGGCACCYCFSGDRDAPTNDQCSENGPTGPRLSPSECDDWCKHEGSFADGGGAPGGPYEDSEYCASDGPCECQTCEDAGGVDNIHPECQKTPAGCTCG